MASPKAWALHTLCVGPLPLWPAAGTDQSRVPSPVWLPGHRSPAWYPLWREVGTTGGCLLYSGTRGPLCPRPQCLLFRLQIRGWPAGLRGWVGTAGRPSTPKPPSPSSPTFSSALALPEASSELERPSSHLPFSLKNSRSSLCSTTGHPHVSFHRKHTDFLQHCSGGEVPGASFTLRPTAVATCCRPGEAAGSPGRCWGVGGPAKMGGGRGGAGAPSLFRAAGVT